MQIVGLAESGVQPLDAIDLNGEVRSGLEVRFVECAVINGLLGISGKVAIGIQSEGMVKGLAAVNREGGGIKDLQFSAGELGFDFLQLLGSAGSGNLLVELGQNDGAVAVALAPILIEFFAVRNSLDDLGK